MTKADPDDPLEVVGRLVAALRPYGVIDVAVTGSAALGVWAAPRQSRDVDLCAAVPAASVARILARFDGIASGASEHPDVLRLRFLNWDVDIFVAGDDPYDHACLKRAVAVATSAGSIRVVTSEDLLVHKLIKLRTDRRRLLQDLADVKAVIEARGQALDWDYLRTWLPAKDATLLYSVSQLDDEEIVRKLVDRNS